MIGSTILHYKVLEKLGQGGMGVVYLAEDIKLGRKVALKFLPHHISADSEAKARFEIEARAAAALNHPNIATIYSIEESDNGVFIAMELIEGIELKKKIREDKISVEEGIDIAIKICEGLEAAHKKEIIHRDIKSSNIMITEDGKIKIMDFGLAKLGGENLTKMGTTLGTIAYMSPEQASGQAVDYQTDIWSLGVVLYELFTGTLPFRGDYDQAIAYCIMNEEPSGLLTYNEEIPPPLDSIVVKALAKNKDERYKSASDLLSDLQVLKKSIDQRSDTTAGEFSFTTKSGISLKPYIQKPYHLKAILILVSIAIFGAFLFYYLPNLEEIISGQSEMSILPEEKHIAVLTFSVIGGNNTDKSLAEGLSEIITSKLSQLEQYKEKLWIVPTSEMKNRNIHTPEDALKAFGINLAITGSVQKSKDRYQLILNLIDPIGKRQISSRIINEPLPGMSSIQNEAVIKSSEMLHIQVAQNIQQTLKEGETQNSEANDYYIQGKGNLIHFENSDNLNMAIKLFGKAIKVDTNFALAYSGLSETYLKIFNKTKDVIYINKASEYCTKAIEISPNLAPVYITLGLLYIKTGKYDEANKVFLKAEEIDPTNIDAYQGQASLYNEQGKLDEAESIYKKVIKMKPDYWAGYAHLGVFYYLHGNYKQAAGQFEQVIKLTPLNAGAYRNLGAMYYYMNQKADAIVMFKRSLEIEPDYTVYSNLATLYYYEGLYADAASTYEKALKMQNTDYSVWGYLGAAYRQSHADSSNIILAFRKAKELAERQLKINPVDPKLLVDIASYCSELELKDSARTILKQIELLNPKDVNVMVLCGETYEQLGNRDRAISWIRKAIINGYSIEELNHIPELENLREDDRYKKIISQHK